MKPIFISHATKDDAVVDRIAGGLNAAGLETWIDHQHGLKPGVDWSLGIDQAINTCACGLFIMSSASLKSDYCRAEWNRVLYLDKPLYVAVIERVPKEDRPTRLGIIQPADLTADFDSGMADLISALTDGAVSDPKAPTPVKLRITGRIDPRLTTIPMSGRDEDLRQIIEHLRTQPVAILGVGGLGKSRLAAEIARTDERVQGAIWHVASDISRADEVIELLRDHFDLPATTDPRDVLKKLRETPTLVVIDNAESVEEGDRRRAYVELITDLVNNATKVLITGRAEWDWDDLPFVHPYQPKRELSPEAAQQVVLDMARFYGTADLTAYAEALADAARLHARLIEVGVRLTQKFDPPKVVRDLLELQSPRVEEALDQMILKTAEQMFAAEGRNIRTALRRLNVCRDGFTYEAAAFILGQWTGKNLDTATLDKRLSALQIWQFVTRRTLEDGRNRYEIDPLVIAVVGEDSRAHDQHFTYYEKLAQQHDQRQDYYGLDIESANLEVAFEWAIQNEPENALWLFNACGEFLSNRGRFGQHLNWVKRVAAALEHNKDLRARAISLHSLGISYSYYPFGDRQANQRRAIEAFEKALQSIPPLNYRDDYALIQSGLATAYMNLAAFENKKLNLRLAIQADQEALKYWSAQTSPYDYAGVHNNLGAAYLDLSALEDRAGNLRHAIKAFQETLKYWTPQTRPIDHAGTLNNLGLAYRGLAEIENRGANLHHAIEIFQEVLKYRTPQGAPIAYAETQQNLGIAYQALGDFMAAIVRWREAEKYYRLMDYAGEADLILSMIAEAEQQQKDSGA